MPGQDAERLSAADESNVVLDAADQVNAVVLAGLLGTGGFVHVDGSLDLDHLRTETGSRLRDPSRSELARLSERVALRSGQRVWEAVALDLDQHIRVVDPVDGLDGLAELCADLMIRPLPRDRPGWELLVVPGASADGPGAVFRAHHAIADGVTAVRLAELLFGVGSTPAAMRVDRPRPAPARRPWWRKLATGIARLTAMVRASVPPTVLLGPISASRGVGFAETDLATLADAARRAGGTINDALLAGVSAAIVAGLRAGAHPVLDVLPASVPVALPDRGRSGNAVGVMMVPLPTDEPDATARIARIAALTAATKEEARAAGTYELTRTRRGARLFGWLARRQRFIVTFVTNVRGPAETLAIGGAPLEHAWPVTPIQGNVRLGVSALSYRGRLACGVHVDATALDASVVAGALSAEFARLVQPRADGG